MQITHNANNMHRLQQLYLITLQLEQITSVLHGNNLIQGVKFSVHTASCGNVPQNMIAFEDRSRALKSPSALNDLNGCAVWPCGLNCLTSPNVLFLCHILLVNAYIHRKVYNIYMVDTYCIKLVRKIWYLISLSSKNCNEAQKRPERPLVNPRHNISAL